MTIPPSSTGPRRFDRPLRGLISIPSRPVWVFLVVGALTLVAFNLLVPLAAGPDEVNHIYRIATIANGNLLPSQYGEADGMPLWGGEVPTALFEALRSLPQYPHFDYGASFYASIQSAGSSTYVNIPNTEVYSLFAYLPSLFAYAIGYMFDLNVFSLIILMRIFSGIFYLGSVTLIIKMSQHTALKWVILVVSLLPVSLFEASTVTADTMTLLSVLALSSVTISEMFLHQKSTNTQKIVLVISALLLPLVKPTYIILIPLIFFVKSFRLSVRFVIFGIAAGAFAFWYKISSGAGYGMGWMRAPEDRHFVLPNEQLSGVISDPFYFIKSLVRTFAMDDTRWFSESFGQMGYFHGGILSASIITSIACVIALILATNGLEVTKRARLAHWTTSIVVLVSVCAILGALYLNFTVVGRAFIEGVQGRYITPLFLLIVSVVATSVPLKLYVPARGDFRESRNSHTFTISEQSSEPIRMYSYHCLTWAPAITLCMIIAQASAIVTFIIRYRYGY